MTKIEINGSETGSVRLFHLDLPAEAIERFVTQAGTGEWPLKYGLGAKELRAAFVEVIDIRDLDGMGLSQYLSEAHSVTGDDFRAMRPQIDALRGHALVLPSQAFGAVSQTLTVSTPLRWIGTFGEVRAKRPGPKLRSASAKGVTGTAGAGSAGRGNSMLLKLLMLGIGIVALLVLGLGLR